MSDNPSVVNIPILQWICLQRNLRERGCRIHESGAFLLGTRTSSGVRCVSYICYDELDPLAYESGVCHITGKAFGRLWEECRQKKLMVIADAHTHPTKAVQQSFSDKMSPLISREGHISIIFPSYASAICGSFNSVGVHEYLGDFRWRQLNGSNLRSRLKMTIW